MTLDAYLTAQPTRCAHGYAPNQLALCPTCTPAAPDLGKAGAAGANEPSGVDAAYPAFVAALRRVVREDSTIHATDVRRELAAQQIPPRTLSSCWRRAKSRRLLVEAGIERSDDHRGRNAGRPEPYYRLAA